MHWIGCEKCGYKEQCPCSANRNHGGITSDSCPVCKRRQAAAEKEVLNVKIQLCREGARFPTKATEGSACYDLYACIPLPEKIEKNFIELHLNRAEKIPTGLKMEIPEGYVGHVYVRSGLGSKGIMLANGVGVIDSDYRGELYVTLINLSNFVHAIQNGDRIGQIEIIRQGPTVRWEQIDGLSETERGEGGFGSTGK
jgi:dUTP pyrophosphatase